MKLSVFENWWERAGDIWKNDRSANIEENLKCPITFHLIDGTHYSTTEQDFFINESYVPKDMCEDNDYAESVSLGIRGRIITFGIESIVSIEW